MRVRNAHGHTKVTFVELFFDLVFVFAVTKLSHGLIEHFTFQSAVQTLLLTMAVWWVWIYTSWVTNWLDPDRTPVRIMLFVLMLAGLVLSAAIPDAFGERGIYFAIAYVFMQVGRSLFTLICLRPHDAVNYRNFQRITAWLATTGVLWIIGGFQEGEARLLWWASAILIEYTLPAIGFRYPGLGRSTTADWKVEGAHMAERCGLFIIIALGESILVVGGTFGELGWNFESIAGFVVSFIGSVAMWWIYFNAGAEMASAHIARTDDPGRLARLAYTYLHIFMVAGIIITAVADEFVLHHKGAEPAAITLLGGAFIYLVGNALFKRVMAGTYSISHGIGLLLLILTAPFHSSFTPLLLSTYTTFVLIVVAACETCGIRQKGSL